MTTDTKKIGQDMVNNVPGMGLSAMRSIAREALNGLDAAGKPTETSKITTAAFNGIKAYFSTWNHRMVMDLAEKFTVAYVNR